MFLKGSTKSSFLARMLSPAATGKRDFSIASLQAFAKVNEATHAAEQQKDVLPTFQGYQYQKLQAHSQEVHNKKMQEQEAAEAQWLA